MLSPQVVTFGEAMLRLSPPGFRRLEQATSLDVAVGGAELNTAVALARLGRGSSWVSRLTRNPLGRLVVNKAHEAGVATDHVVWTDDDRVGLYFVEFGAAPRASSVLYDRRNAAIAGVRPGMIDWGKVFAGARHFHVTGITPALSASAAAATTEAIHAARKAGVRVSIDLNYRAKLWSPAEAGRWMQEALPHCDCLITTEEDAGKVLGVQGDNYENVARELARRYSFQVVAITLRDNPLVWRNSWTAIALHEGRLLKTRSFEVEIVDRLGAGDSFAAGLIHGLLDGDVQKGLDYGVAVSALKHTLPTDFAWVTPDEVETLLRSGNLRISR
jgi:2-dehydro-3-deoxygluconokinase